MIKAATKQQTPTPAIIPVVSKLTLKAKYAADAAAPASIPATANVHIATVGHLLFCVFFVAVILPFPGLLGSLPLVLVSLFCSGTRILGTPDCSSSLLPFIGDLISV